MTRYPLTAAQERCWIAEDLHPGTTISMIGGVVRIYGDLDTARLRDALEAARAEFDAFRFRITGTGEMRTQEIASAPTGEINETDLRPMRMRDNPEFDDWAKRLFLEPPDISAGILHQLTAFRTSDGGGYVVQMHHSLADGWSMSLLTPFVERAYAHPNPLNWREGAPSFRLALNTRRAYFSTPAYERDRQYWAERLQDVSHFLPQRTSVEGGRGIRTAFSLSLEDSALLRGFAKASGLSINQLLLALHTIYLGHRDGRAGGTVGCLLLDRHDRTERQTFGMLTTHMPFAWTLDPDESFAQAAQRVSRDFRQAIRHGRFPTNRMLEGLDDTLIRGRSLFDTCINYYAFGHAPEFGGVSQSVEDLYPGHQPYPLQIVIRDWRHDGRVQLLYDHAPASHSEAEIGAMHEGHIALLRSFAGAPNRPLRSASPIATETARARRRLMTGPEVAPTELADVVAAVREHARRAPGTTALITDDTRIGYGDLERQAARLAQELHASGIGEGDTVGLLMERGPEVISAILAVLWVGASFVPLGTRLPKYSLASMCEQAGIALILHDDSNAARAGELGPLLMPITWNVNAAPATPPAQATGETAYVLFTSGSTGVPKGVQIDRRNLENYIQYSSRYYYQSDDLAAFYTPLTFDMTLTAVLSPISAGAAIRIYPPTIDASAALRFAIERDGVSVLKITPSHLKLLADLHGERGRIRNFVVGGEDLRTSLAERVQARFPDAAIYNEYGPTEATVGCMIARFGEDGAAQAKSVPIGRPIDNTRIKVLGPWGSEATVGAAGEIVILGASVGRAYIGRPDLTAERFFVSSDGTGIRGFRTGDLGCFLDQSTLVYLGRRDRQVKVLGHRIELNEIEAVASHHPAVTQTVATVLTDAEGEVSGVALAVTPQTVDQVKLRAFLEERLAAYMVPSLIYPCDAIPLTENGKADVQALQSRLAASGAVQHHHQGADALEQEITAVAAEILGHPSLSASDNLFLHGLDSIKSLRIASRLAHHNICSAQVLASNTTAQIAERCRRGVAEQTEVPLDRWALLPTAASAWFLAGNAPHPDRYAHVVTLELTEPITSADKLHEPLNALIRRHPALRQRFAAGSQRPEILPAEEAQTSVMVFDADQPRSKITSALLDCLNLRKGALFGAGLVQGQPQRLILCAHHVAVDAMSWFTILNELDRSLNQSSPSANSQEPPQRASGFLERGAALSQLVVDMPAEDRERWRALATATAPEFTASPESARKELRELTRSLSLNGGKLESKGREIYGLDTEALVLAATIEALAPWTKGPHCRIQLERAGRTTLQNGSSAGMEVGWFSALFPVAPPAQASDWDERLRAVKEHLASLPAPAEAYGALCHLAHRLPPVPPIVRLNPLGSMGMIALKTMAVVETESGLLNQTGHAMDCALEIDIAWSDTGLRLHLRSDPSRLCNEDLFCVAERLESALTNLDAYLNSCTHRVLSPSNFELVELSQEELEAILGEAELHEGGRQYDA